MTPPRFAHPARIAGAAPGAARAPQKRDEARVGLGRPARLWLGE